MHAKIAQTTIKTFGLAFVLSLTTAFGCSSEDNGGNGGGGGDGGDGGSSSDGGGGGGTTSPGEPSPLYAISTEVLSADFSMLTVYTLLTGSIDKDTELDYTKAIETPGYSFSFAQPKSKELFVLDVDSLAIDKYEVGEGGELNEVGTLALGAQGVTRFLYKAVELIDDETAYFMNNETGKVIVWNPSTMRITGEIDISGIASKGFPIAFLHNASIKRRGDQLFVFDNSTSATGDVPKETRVAIIDVTTNEAKIVSDTRCRASWPVLAANGDLYVSSDTYVASASRAGLGTEPCMLRIRAGEDTFDPSYQLELNSLANGASVGGILAGKGDEAYVLVLDEEAFPVTPETNPFAMWAAGVWNWWRITLGSDGPAEKVAGADPSAGATLPYPLDDESYAGATAQGLSESWLLRMSADDQPERGLTVRGAIVTIVRVR